MNSVRITVYPRIHISLIDMGQFGYRVNGGAGFSVSNPQTMLEFSISNSFEIEDYRRKPLTCEERKRWYGVIKACYDENNLTNHIHCSIKGDALPHHGFGTGTSLYMASIEALFILNNKEYEPSDVVRFSKRGGTSGVGINTYFDGGFVFDVGVRNNQQGLRPSSVINESSIPLTLTKSQIPEWEIGICVPKGIEAKTEKEEIDFFSTDRNYSTKDSSKVLYELICGVAASIVERDYDTFCSSINKIQKCKWKSDERSLYGKKLEEMENNIRTLGADSIGMSSFGPVLYFTAKNVQNIVNILNKQENALNAICASLNNKGRIIEYV